MDTKHIPYIPDQFDFPVSYRPWEPPLRSPAEIEAVLQWARRIQAGEDPEVNGNTANPGSTYEDGVRLALEWVRGDHDCRPDEPGRGA